MSAPNIPGIKKLCFRCGNPWDSVESRFDVTWYKCRCGAKLRWEKIHGAKGIACEDPEPQTKKATPPSIPMGLSNIAPLLHDPSPAPESPGVESAVRPEDF